MATRTKKSRRKSIRKKKSLRKKFIKARRRQAGHKSRKFA